jgi:ribonuclease P protein component
MAKLVMLKKTDDFSSVFSFKKRLYSSFLVVHYGSNQTAEMRLGFIVAKKTAKLSVDRNYMRRALRELCRQESRALLGVDVIVQVKKPFKNKDFLQLKQEFNFLFDKIGKLTSERTIHA